ncbi:hypothetical protein [Agarivorans gilvus]|jgi:hypothetical protein|uniref:Uncharacterized protein n=1 Tax=Agarivorans gilvus TaxID=680279 RepID=A0ABQ1I740_9ALTE|nr:hypothetical protein [Agarivorans gilvus]GGB17783.1 hypothetical protein GCM10007414_34000 [Agarivorans gilvus]
MQQIYIAFERLSGLLSKEKTVYLPFNGSVEEAEAHLHSEEFDLFLSTTLGSNPRVVTNKH